MATVTTPSGAKVDSITGKLVTGPNDFLDYTFDRVGAPKSTLQTLPDNGSYSGGLQKLNTVSSQALSSPSAPINLPNFQQANPQELQAKIASVPSYESIVAGYNQPTKEEQDFSSLASELRSKLEKYSTQGLGVNEDGSFDTSYVQKKREMEAGIPGKSTELQGVIGRINQLKAESLAIPLQIQDEFTGSGATQGGVEPIQTSRLRKNAIQSLSLSAQASALQGDIALAQSQIKDAIELELAPEKIRLGYLKQAYEMNKDALVRADKKKADKMAADITERERILEEQRTEKTNISEILITAAENKADAVTLDKIRTAKTVDDAISLASKFLSPADKPNLQIVDLGKDAAGNDLGKVLIDMNKRGEIVKSFGGAPVGASAPILKGQYGSLISTAAGLVGAERGKTTKAAMSQALANNDYATTWALIANNVEESLTGEVKSRFANQRNDYVALQGLRDAINEYAAAGGNMGLLVGTEEEIKRKLGIDSGRASALAVQLWREFQVYRNVLTGAAFSPQESADYASVNPTLKKGLKLNLSVIDGSLAQLENRIVSTVNTRVPGASDIFNNVNGQVQARSDGLSDDAAYQEYLKMSK